MGAGVANRCGETAQHARLKQLAFVWAQTHGFSACAMEVSLPKCRYRADVAGYRPQPKQIGSAVEARLHSHYPNLHSGDSLFPEFDSENFVAIGHRGYARLARELRALQNRLYDCTKFEKLIRYRCANLFFIVLPRQLFRELEVPIGWGALVESNGSLTLVRKPLWHDATADNRIRLLHRIAVAGTRNLNQQLLIAPGEIAVTPSQFRHS